eukprot:CAMPEP_0172573986 /NCGR_PEP_ID=MMETSP1067-20121228/136475_1 /TAXON_ID=265564 ORGANISM="Thalassiosira punctigera, Strain Tpunct2005C2" /NCGR_SAMPLE_ID=MMETSP1067 /ASSEMBLY_ACC=CAM_ASM_000444 /LENGTH=92 /DNA_ID=CAMNT_0013366609 /DNA_START=846 /DNA_END=1122 /DNA_ORIENTATION=+
MSTHHSKANSATSLPHLEATADSRIDVSRVAAAACRIPDGGDAAGAGVPSTGALDGAEIGRSGLPQPVGAEVFTAVPRPSEPEPTAPKSSPA